VMSSLVVSPDLVCWARRPPCPRSCCLPVGAAFFLAARPAWPFLSWPLPPPAENQHDRRTEHRATDSRTDRCVWMSWGTIQGKVSPRSSVSAGYTSTVGCHGERVERASCRARTTMTFTCWLRSPFARGRVPVTEIDTRTGMVTVCFGPGSECHAGKPFQLLAGRSWRYRGRRRAGPPRPRTVLSWSRPPKRSPLRSGSGTTRNHEIAVVNWCSSAKPNGERRDALLSEIAIAHVVVHRRGRHR